MKRFILTAIVLITLGSCKAEEGNSIQLGGVILPETDCSFKVSGENFSIFNHWTWSGGVVDF